MTQDLIVQQGTTVELSATPPTALQESLQRVQIQTFRDLVSSGLVASEEHLHKLLVSAKTVTATTLRSPGTFTPFLAVPGTLRPDLRRFGGFLAEAQAAGVDNQVEVNTFWRIARTIEPMLLAQAEIDTPLTRLRPQTGNRLFDQDVIRFLFRNVTVEPHSNLVVAASVHLFNCDHLLIKRAGKITVQGSAIVIKAHSIQGEQ